MYTLTISLHSGSASNRSDGRLGSCNRIFGPPVLREIDLRSDAQLISLLLVVIRGLIAHKVVFFPADSGHGVFREEFRNASCRSPGAESRAEAVNGIPQALASPSKSSPSYLAGSPAFNFSGRKRYTRLHKSLEQEQEMSTATLRLTEPYVLLIGATEHERALARRRRREAGTPRQTPGNSPPNSRPPSPPPGISAIVEGNFVPPFVRPSSRGGAGARGMSPVPLLAGGGSSRSASRSRTTEGTTTGMGTTAEANAADEPPPAILRGLLTITLAKPSRIRSISVRLRGISRTDWPEGQFAFYITLSRRSS